MGLPWTGRSHSLCNTNPPPPTTTPTKQLGAALAKMGAIEYTAPPSMDELRKFHLAGRGPAIRAGARATRYDSDEEGGELSD